MTDDGRIPFQVGASASQTVTVDPSRSYQRVDGFGASITDSSAHVLYELGGLRRAATMRDLFSPTDGDGSRCCVSRWVPRTSIGGRLIDDPRIYRAYAT